MHKSYTIWFIDNSYLFIQKKYLENVKPLKVYGV